MARTIISQFDVDRSVHAGEPPTAADGYTERLIKFIPPDVIAGYIGIEGIVSAAPPAPNIQVLGWIVFAVITAACPFYLIKSAGVYKPKQVALSTIAFLVWAFAYSGPPFAYLEISAVWRAVILSLFTFLIPLLPV